MEKKTYEIPTMTVIAVKPASIICGSGPASTTSFHSETWGSDNDPDETDENYYNAE